MARLLFGYLLFFNCFESKSQETFLEVMGLFPEYELPLDPQSLVYPDETISIQVFNEFFTNYISEDPYILLANGEKSYAAVAGEIEEEFFEYDEGKFDTTRVYPLGRVSLHANYSSLLFCISEKEFDNIYIYNFDNSGTIRSGLFLTVKDNFSPNYRASLKEYGFIQGDGIIFKRNFGEVDSQEVSICINEEGVFQVLSSEYDGNYYDDPDWPTNKKQAEMDQFALDGIPTLK